MCTVDYSGYRGITNKFICGPDANATNRRTKCGFNRWEHSFTIQPTFTKVLLAVWTSEYRKIPTCPFDIFDLNSKNTRLTFVSFGLFIVSIETYGFNTPHRFGRRRFFNITRPWILVRYTLHEPNVCGHLEWDDQRTHGGKGQVSTNLWKL